MLFNSWAFIVFFVFVYAVYLKLPHRAQNHFLLAASYFFYACWDWRFLGLIFISTLMEYACALEIDCQQIESQRKFFLTLSLVFNIVLLGFFKYFNFFTHGLVSLGSLVGWDIPLPALHVILPVGISFYTFQGMSYTVDVYHRQAKPARKLLDYALYVSFFPQLLAGPIGRVKFLLVQVLEPRVITGARIREGLYLVGFGFFKKVFVADNLAPIVSHVFSKGGGLSAWEVLLGCYAFSFQIYADFSGYSDIARGLSKMMGFELMLNFNLPYFSTSPRDFWRRWHISLSSWLRDYLYIPLGGSKQGALRTYASLLLTMSLGGLWHGAAWTFVAWGIYHGILLIFNRTFSRTSERVGSFFGFNLGPSSVRTVLEIFITFHLIAAGWLLFRARSLAQAGAFLHALLAGGKLDRVTFYYFKEFAFFTFFLLLIDGVEYFKKDPYWILSAKPSVQILLAGLLAACLVVWYTLGLPGGNQFIYFQF